MRRRRRSGLLRLLVVLVFVAGAAAVVLRWWASGPEPRASARAPATTASPLPLRRLGASCGGPASPDAAQANAASLHDLAWSLSGRGILGWEIYQPLVGRELASDCPAGSPGFAAALALWQAAHGLAASGRMDAGSFEALWVGMLRRRPFVRAMAAGCPAPPDPADLEPARPDETLAGQTNLLARREALAAYRTLLAAARADAPAIRADPQALKIISAFRAPQLDGGDCPPGQVCFNLTRANCSAHRTGLAFDLYVGAAPGRSATSTEDDNRLYQSRTLAYRWLVAHAAQYGFLPYPYEPWHWEWTA